MTRNSSLLRCGALAGLALLFVCDVAADEALRVEVHRQYKHQSYMLVEDAEGAWLYLFDRQTAPLRLASDGAPLADIERSLEKTRSASARVRVRGLTELAGVDDARALDTALALLNDTHAAVRDEAEQLILDHPDGAALASALGLADASEFPEDPDRGQ
jgi:hypothetical protein